MLALIKCIAAKSRHVFPVEESVWDCDRREAASVFSTNHNLFLVNVAQLSCICLLPTTSEPFSSTELSTSLYIRPFQAYNRIQCDYIQFRFKLSVLHLFPKPKYIYNALKNATTSFQLGQGWRKMFDNVTWSYILFAPGSTPWWTQWPGCVQRWAGETTIRAAEFYLDFASRAWHPKESAEKELVHLQGSIFALPVFWRNLLSVSHTFLSKHLSPNPLIRHSNAVQGKKWCRLAL